MGSCRDNGSNLEKLEIRRFRSTKTGEIIEREVRNGAFKREMRSR